MTKISKNPAPDVFEERDVTLVESREALTNPEILQTSRHVRIRLAANGAEVDALLSTDSRTAVKVHEAGAGSFPQWSNKGKGIWTSPNAHQIAQTNRKWTREGELGAKDKTGGPIDPHAQAISWPTMKPVHGPDGQLSYEEEDPDNVGYALRNGVTLE